MAPRENNLNSLREFANAAIVHRVAARFALEALVADTKESAGKMPALPKPLQTNAAKDEKLLHALGWIPPALCAADVEDLSRVIRVVRRDVRDA